MDHPLLACLDGSDAAERGPREAASREARP